MPGRKPSIYLVGNPLVPDDSLPFRIREKLSRRLPSFNFQELDPNENIENLTGTLYLIDTAQGLKKVQLLENIDQLKVEYVCSPHDFDLAYTLKLLKKIGQIKDVKIFGLPMGMDEEEAVRQLVPLLISNVASKSE